MVPMQGQQGIPARLPIQGQHGAPTTLTAQGQSTMMQLAVPAMLPVQVTPQEAQSAAQITIGQSRYASALPFYAAAGTWPVPHFRRR